MSNSLPQNILNEFESAPLKTSGPTRSLERHTIPARPAESMEDYTEWESELKKITSGNYFSNPINKLFILSYRAQKVNIESLDLCQPKELSRPLYFP